MTLRVKVDEDLPTAIAQLVRASGYDAVTPISLEGGSGAGIGKYSMPQDVRRRG